MLRYECELSSEALKKAMAELNEPEDNDMRLTEIDKLRTRFQEEVKDLELIRTDDSFLLRFLRVCKFDQDRAFQRLCCYHRNRKEWKELFDMVDNPTELEDMIMYGPIYALPERAIDGTFVILVKPGFGLDSKQNIIKMFAIAVLTIETLLENEEMQIYGLTIVEDLKEFSVSLGMKMIGLEQKFLNIVQNALPVRVKSLNTVNEYLIFDAIYAIAKHFISEKLKKRIHLHGSEFKTLHKIIAQEFLPPCLGGTGPEMDMKAFKEKLLSTVGEGEDTSL